MTDIWTYIQASSKTRHWTARALVLGLGLLVGGAMPAQAQTELTVWHGYRGDEKAAFEKVCGLYSQATDGVGIKTLAVPYDAYADKITAAVPRGKGPDVFIFAQDRMGGWIESGRTIEPLDFFIEDEVHDRFLETTINAMTYRGTIYGLPLNFKCITLIYNKKLISDPPETSSELVKVAKQLTDVKIGKFGVAYSYADFYYHAALMNAFGGGVFDDKGRPTMASEPNIKALELLMRWVDQDGFLPAEPSTALVTSLFNGGKAAMVLSGPWFLGEVSDEIEIGLAPLPTIVEADNQPMRPWMTVEGVYISAQSKHKDEAYDLITHLTDLEAGLIMSLEGRQTPANKKVYESKKVSSDPVLAAFRKQVEVAIPMPNRAEMTMVWSPATTAMNATVRRSATPRSALEQAQKEVAERIAKLHG